MRLPLTLSRLTHLTALSAFLLSSTGCHSWVTTTVPTQGRLQGNPRVVRVVLSRPNSVQTLRDPVVSGDSLIGFSGTSANPAQVTVPLSQIARVQTWSFSVARTAGLALLLTPVVLLGAWIVIGISLTSGQRSGGS
jgi:hypothetical protein